MATPTQQLATRLREIYRGATGEQFATGLAGLFDEDSWASAFNGDDNRWYGPDQILEGWLLPETRNHPDYRRELGPVWVDGTNILIFSKVSTAIANGHRAEWLAVDVFQAVHGRIITARFGNDTLPRQSLDRTVDVSDFWTDIDTSWKPMTTAANRVGFKAVIDAKSHRGSAAQVYGPIIERQREDVQWWSWEVNGLLHRAGEAVRRDLWEPLFELIPDFTEAIEEPIVFGNALLLVQNPAGTFTNAHGTTGYSAWYNLDIYLFEEQRISRLFWARDTLKDESQMLAAFDGAPPALPASLHTVPFSETPG